MPSQPPQPLTKRQQQVLEFLRAHQARHGMPPTRLEIAAHFGFASASVAEKHLRLIAAKGAIELLPGASRGIRLPDTGLAEFVESVPLVGRIAAGQPLLSAEHVDERHALDRRLFARRPHFLRRVSGDSMDDAGLRDGDLAAIHQSSEAANGQVVAFRFEGPDGEHDELTLKRYRRQGNRITLSSENVRRNYPPMVVDLDRGRLELGLGKVRDLRGTRFGLEGILVGAITLPRR